MSNANQLSERGILFGRLPILLLDALSVPGSLFGRQSVIYQNIATRDNVLISLNISGAGCRVAQAERWCEDAGRYAENSACGNDFDGVVFHHFFAPCIVTLPPAWMLSLPLMIATMIVTIPLIMMTFTSVFIGVGIRIKQQNLNAAR
ncbi:hypothetical protein [Chlorobaculum tepidum]|uniref:hypothetical protein n=1 Tax=Chlorobaculum tepidum TaxID=1097 RepID=UPI0013E8B4B9|nr:hypothetical protein [Chlorobaculum tepidum]